MPSSLKESIKERVENKIWHKKWGEAEISGILGTYKKVFFTYANNPALREKAASGGSTTALLLHLLETEQIDGALVLKTVIKEGKARPEFLIATNQEELKSAQGSKYSAVYFTQYAFPLIESFHGNLAVVALPCDAKILSSYKQRNPTFDKKIKFIFTLVCGHNSEPELTDLVVEKLRPTSNAELKNYDYRSGHWRGKLRAEFNEGSAKDKPFSYFSDYRNLYLFAQPKCHHCFDHFGYYCDISAGDIWSPQMKNEPVKHTALIARTDAGEKLIQDAINSSILVGYEENVEAILNGQARTAPFHYNISARSKVGKIFGVTIQDQTQSDVRWNDYIVAFVALLNEQVSQTSLGRRLIPLIPRPLLKIYLFFFKGMESL